MIAEIITANTPKKNVMSIVKEMLQKYDLTVENIDDARPWGGFFRIAEKDIEKFKQHYFKDYQFKDNIKDAKMSPKILIVAPTARLSWQYHFRRQELWKVIMGPVDVMMSITDNQTLPQTFNTDSIVELGKGIRHRLIGKDNWGIVAEIWEHTDETKSSDEEDIVRLQDDYGR